jgi:AcrR family transcriptional regulator
MGNADIRRVLERAEPGARRAHKRHVMACALDCFERDGLDAATIEQIRALADSSIGSIYHHFGNKDGLVAALFFAAMDDESALEAARLERVASPREAVEACVGSYLEWVSEQPRLARFMYRARAAVAAGPHGEALRARNRAKHQAMRDWLRRGIEDGSIRELPKETYVPLLIGQAETYCRAWLSERVRGKPSDHAAVFADAAWRSVAA